jgi:predicted small lipoprotein YifL
MLRAALMMLLCLGLAGCGKRPGYIDPPEDATPGAYARTYPDLSTDPAPEKNP